MRISNEIKAGVVVLLAVVIGIFFFYKTAGVKPSTYTVKTRFVYAGDLKPNAIVKLSGIEVGRLLTAEFSYDPNTAVECVLEIDSRAKLRKDSIAYIGTAGFVGDAFVGITPGVSPEFMEEGGMLDSEDPVQMRILMKKAEEIANSLDGILKDVKSIVADNKGNIDSIVLNLEATSQNLKEFSEDVKKSPWKLLFKGE
ncbi:MAG: MlaD family protein [Candidatus Omnitrophica bacterium]|nr:MlaD family protein [Candidatus Omnitrophota bacterium]MDD4013361.1 MlaD family protein [Candidatus Omnitrophota bacterium]